MAERFKEMKDIRRRLSQIDRKLDQLLRLQSSQSYRRVFVPKTLASLPDHLRKTALTIATMGRATAEQVAVKTGRTRAAESDYLNQLASRGFLQKERKGREVHFLVFTLYTTCTQCGASVPMTLDQCPICRAFLHRKQ